MKKTLLATAIIGAMGASAAAQAATVYDQDGTKLDIYGRVVYGITTGGPDGGTSTVRSETVLDDGTVVVTEEESNVRSSGSDFIDLGSRFGFIADHEVTRDLSVFARMEFRGDADAQNTGGFDTIRNTYLGARSDSWGSVQAGNFDSVYYRSGDVIFDVPENLGWEQLGGISADSRGDAISYSTPELSGFRAHVQAKHLSGNTNDITAGQDNSATWTTAAAVDYTINDLYMSLGYSQGKDVSDRGASYDGGSPYAAGEDLFGFFANYDVTDAFSLRFKYEEISSKFGQDVLDTRASSSNQTVSDRAVNAEESIMGLGATYDYGMGEVYGQYARVDMAFDGVDDKDRWMLGGNYRFSQPMYVFAEVYQEDSGTSFDESLTDNFRSLDDEILTTVGVRYDF
ncbi:porin [Halovibrio variabilis]|uniref:Porin n=1 Tax=Halovibrio variabilis TaxID=31910 RepID=A0A511UR87_9GAMM|nr:porin [Halovibrio variabilis]GEN27712.1 porin [Halovibrio variabilis]